MSTGAALGMILMLGAVVWCLASLVRVVIGPGRKAALVRSGQSILVFFIGAIIVGTFGGQPQGHTAAPTGSAASTRSEISAPSQPQPDMAQAALAAPSETSERPPITVPTVAARYQTSPTLISLVIAGFNPTLSEALRDIAEAECAGANFCSIGFWTDNAMAPRTLRMSDEAMGARLAHYVHSQSTGLDAFKWNCDMVPSTDDCL